MLTDEVIIKIKAGKGGSGLASFRREKYVPKGGPDGGDGGDGGDIIFRTTNDINTLTFFNARKVFSAQNGESGRKARCHGKNGKDLVLAVPPGTVFYEFSADLTTNKKVADLTQEGEEIILAQGGKGGLGNVHFATSTHQTPYEFGPGALGEEKTLKLELRLIADVGIIGLPNSGKSTFLSRISQARPKIANYAFTTLAPNLGVVNVDKEFNFVAADIPGLIEGASKGRGLGHKFLRHIMRTKILVHLIDISRDNLVDDYKVVHDELKLFNARLAQKKEIVVLSKCDLSGGLKVKIPPSIKRLKPLMISSVSGEGLRELLFVIKSDLAK